MKSVQILIVKHQINVRVSLEDVHSIDKYFVESMIKIQKLENCGSAITIVIL